MTSSNCKWCTAFSHMIKSWTNKINVTLSCSTIVLLAIKYLRVSVYKGTSPLICKSWFQMKWWIDQFNAAKDCNRRQSRGNGKCWYPQSLVSKEWIFFHMQVVEKVSFQMIPNLPCFSGEFVTNGCFREWLHLCCVESVLHCFFSLKEIFSSGTYLKVGITEKSYDFFSWELCSVKA